MSHDTLTRLLRATSTADLSTPLVLGVDDFALKKGRRYGTLLVDLERHRPVDLLPDRTADTLSAWLRAHEGVKVIARDRAHAYARGATAGAPEAVHVADRWHILKNHREALERMLGRLHAELRLLPTPVPRLSQAISASAVTAVQTRCVLAPTEQRARQATRARRYQHYQDVQTRHNQGISILQIAKRLNISRTTVYSFAAVLSG